MRRRARIMVLGAGLVAATALAATIGAAAWWARRPALAPAVTTLEQLGDYGVVPDFALTERSGRRITRDELRGLVWVTDFIYTECRETCPTQSLEFAQLQREFAEAANLRLVSITVDPAHDTPAVLRRYAERYGAGERWWFLTGDKRDIYCLALEGFRLTVADPAAAEAPVCGRAWRPGPARAWSSHGSGGLVMHSARVVLVDRTARIRAYHLAVDPASVDRLRANVRVILAERSSGKGPR